MAYCCTANALCLAPPPTPLSPLPGALKFALYPVPPNHRRTPPLLPLLPGAPPPRSGPLYYVIVLIAITALYWRDSPVGLTIASLMCGGDGLADIVGRRLGSGNQLPWNPEKSWAGSAAMFFGEAQPRRHGQP